MAVEQNGYSQTGAVVSTVGRLLFWHWLQPVMYLIVLAIYSREIGDVLFVLGCLVAVREGIYLLSLIFCLCPAYLLVDVYASVHLDAAAADGHPMDAFGFSLMSTGGMPFLGLYVLTPEKFLLITTFSRWQLSVLAALAVMVLSFAAVLAAVVQGWAPLLWCFWCCHAAVAVASALCTRITGGLQRSAVARTFRSGLYWP